MPTAKRFEILSTCDHCQAYPDAGDLFDEIENVARRYRLDDPERMARALAVVVAMWSVTSAKYIANVTELSAQQADELRCRVLADVQRALEVYLDPNLKAQPEHSH